MLDFVRAAPMPNFRKVRELYLRRWFSYSLQTSWSRQLTSIYYFHFQVWEELPPESERVDDYGLGTRESLEEAVEAVMTILGMHPCEGTEVVPPNARSHATILSGLLVGNVTVLVRLNLGIDASSNVAMKVTARAEDDSASELIHTIISHA